MDWTSCSAFLLFCSWTRRSSDTKWSRFGENFLLRYRSREHAFKINSKPPCLGRWQCSPGHHTSGDIVASRWTNWKVPCWSRSCGLVNNLRHGTPSLFPERGRNRIRAVIFSRCQWTRIEAALDRISAQLLERWETRGTRAESCNVHSASHSPIVFLYSKTTPLPRVRENFCDQLAFFHSQQRCQRHGTISFCECYGFFPPDKACWWHAMYLRHQWTMPSIFISANHIHRDRCVPTNPRSRLQARNMHIPTLASMTCLTRDANVQAVFKSGHLARLISNEPWCTFS